MARRLSTLSALLFAVVVAMAAAAAASPGRRSASFDSAGAVLTIDERGIIDGQLFDERGEMKPNPRLRLVRRKDTLDQRLAARQQPGFDYGSQKVRGVNIGGWLVAEPWITPSLFDNTGNSKVVDEWTYGQYVKNAASKLEQHWATFITENDFQQIAAAGLNHVRIPIGYWALDKGSSKFVQGSQYNYLKKAVGWARNAGLKVIVDLHGAPGSQNGFDNSGKKGPLNWYSKQSYMDRTTAVVQRFAQDFASQTDVVTMIELLNEPLTTAGPSNAVSFMRQYYEAGYQAVRNVGGTSNFAVAVHDGFQRLSYWQGAYPSPQYNQVLLDTHIYTVFSPGEIAMSHSARLQTYCGRKSDIGASQSNLYTIVGEWTSAPTDCAKYLNGRGVGSRYDGTYPGTSKKGNCKSKTGSGSNFSATYKSQLAQLFDTQRKVYETGSGWVYWTWKTEQAGDWDYQKQLSLGIITRNLNSFNNAAC